MISPSLTSTQLEVKRREIMIEAAGLVKDTTIQVTDHGASATIDRDGLYRFTADDTPMAATLEGRMEVLQGERRLELNKGHEAVLTAELKADKLDAKKEDDLYAWSNVRSQYEAAASYQSANTVNQANAGAWGGYGFGPMFAPGWFYNGMFNSWAWLPANGAFYSPFGWGFYSPGMIGYAPVIMAPVYRGTYWAGGAASPVRRGGTTAPVAVNPNNPPAVGALSASPYVNRMQRQQVAAAFAQTGYRSANGGPAMAYSGHQAGSVHGSWSRPSSSPAPRAESAGRGSFAAPAPSSSSSLGSAHGMSAPPSGGHH
jgi:hypothetical protein